MKTELGTESAGGVGRSDRFGNWQQISTHPRSQNLVLLSDGRKQMTGYYGGANSGWRTSETSSMWPEPTHWMPLPPLPNNQAQPRGN